MTQARVVMSTGDHCVISDAQGQLHRCQLRGRRQTRPVCGDYVDWQLQGDEGLIERVEPRANVIERGDFRGRPRPLAANIDRLVLVIAAEPAPDRLLIDRYLVLAHVIERPLLLWVNKIDDPDAPLPTALRELIDDYAAIGVPALLGSAQTGAGLAALEAQIAGETVILVGQSGVGKSSLTQRILPALDLRIGAISATSGQGRHTTSETTLFERPEGGALIDSPGVRTLRLEHLSAADITHAFPEIQTKLGQCRFRNCQHRQEPDCAVLEARSKGQIREARWQNWQRLLDEAQLAVKKS